MYLIITSIMMVMMIIILYREN